MDKEPEKPIHEVIKTLEKINKRLADIDNDIKYIKKNIQKKEDKPISKGWFIT